MDAYEFIKNHKGYVNEIELVIKPEYQSIVTKLKETDPHDLIVPETWFISERSARGFVWNLFIRRVKLSSKIE
ncbi:MAG: hypothetical protein ACOYO1_18695 [Bacteroidales bacterium]